MSTKNVALDSKVYRRLARFKNESESFSKAIDQLLTRIESEHTGAQILQQLAGLSPLRKEDAEAMLKLVAENRISETWEEHDLS